VSVVETGPPASGRYEFKYVVDEATADAIRDRAVLWMEPDASGDGGQYRVTSLYMDRTDWLLARQTFEGLRERFKLRLRFYSACDEEPAPDEVRWFAEVKQRIGKTIRKLRIPTDVEQARAIALGLPTDHVAAPWFMSLAERIDARPMLWVRYDREAMASPWGDGARLTFDRNIEVQPPRSVSDGRSVDPLVAVPSEWRSIELDRPVVIEMKFNDAYPAWMRQIAETLHLRRVSCSKYGHGAEIMGDLPWALGA
jgi:hypothetical protein